MPRHSRFLKEHHLYVALFTALSVGYILNGYALLVTNDDWALWAMLKAKGYYGTLIMSYPLSFIVSKLYDVAPSLPWYSMLLSAVMGINFYLVARFIASLESRIQKAVVLLFALLWMTYLWFNLSITALTVTTVAVAVGASAFQPRLSFVLLGLAFLLRSNIAFILVPFYAVGYLVLRPRILPSKRESLALLALLVTVVTVASLPAIDKPYAQWYRFNKARAALADMGVMHGPRSQFTQDQWLLIALSWWQEDRILPSETLIKATPTLWEILRHNTQHIDTTRLLALVRHHKFHYWIWLLLCASLLIVVLQRRLKSAALLLFALGVFLLLITRDVERVTVSLLIMWAIVVFVGIRRYPWIGTGFVALFGAIFYLYVSPQLGYRYFNEVQALKDEAHRLIAKSGKVCEVSVNMPTDFSYDMNTIFTYNFLFHENRWMHVNRHEILPTGWLCRHPFYYDTHQISDTRTKRRYDSYHAYLIDEHTAFFGGKTLAKNKLFKRLLNLYDRYYPSKDASCRHKAQIIAASRHFAVSQIRLVCDDQVTKDPSLWP